MTVKLQLKIVIYRNCLKNRDIHLFNILYIYIKINKKTKYTQKRDKKLKVFITFMENKRIIYWIRQL